MPVGFIELEQIDKQYTRGVAPAVHNISLSVEPHNLLALLGPSGSGKSTVLKLIAGIEHPDRGDIRLEGQSVVRVPAHQRGAVLMFQKAYLFPFLSVADNIAFGLRVQGARRDTIQTEVARMLDLVGLPGMQQRRPAQLSGGEQQRIALARALVTRPRVLLLDEPFSSLDAAVRQTLQEAVRRIQRELGITAVLVTHDRAEALSMADRVALIDHGTLVAQDTPRRIYERPPTHRAARQMGVENFLYGAIEGMTLHSQLGPLALAEEYPAQASACFAIRPEHLCLRPYQEPNSLAATVMAVSFRGEHVEYQLHVGTEMLRVRDSHASDWTTGDQVFVHIPPVQLFPVADDENL